MKENSKILIVEDDVDLVAAMKKILESCGYNVSTAYDPEEGMERLKALKPDLIILDVMFGSAGESKGFDFAQEIRQHKDLAYVPILMLTAINTQKPFFNFSPDTDDEYMPVDAFMNKPVQSEALCNKVEALLKQKISKWQNWPNKQ